jgi:restriction endonuclease Mrr
MQDLPLTTMWHQKDPSSQDVDKIDPASLPIPSDYKERIIRVDRLPLKVVKKILEDPRHMHALSPREFEELIAEIVDGLGFTNVVLTPGTGDGGRDVIASKEISGIPITMYFECKKYAEGSKVQVATLRSLLGVVAHESRQANIGVLVTTSSFTRGARDLILSDCRLDGKDYDGIIGWVHELGRDALPGDPT